MNKFVCILLLTVLCACQPKTVDNDGGVYIEVVVGSNNSSPALISQTENIIKKRILDNCKYDPEFIFDSLQRIIKIGLPLEYDTSFYRELLMIKGQCITLQTYENAEFYPTLLSINEWLKKNLKQNYLPGDTSEMYRTNPLFTIIRPAIGTDKLPSPGAEIGNCKIEDTSKVNKIFNLPEIRALLPADVDIKMGKSSYNEDLYSLFVCKKPVDYVAITGSMYDDVHIGYKNNNYQYYITFKLGELFYNLWEKTTRENIGRSLALVLDNQVYSTLMIDSEISNGYVLIYQDINLRTAKLLVSSIRNGEINTALEIRKIEIIDKN